MKILLQQNKYSFFILYNTTPVLQLMEKPQDSKQNLLSTS